MKPLLPVALAVAMVSLGADDGRARFNISASDPSNPCDPNAFWVNSTSGAMFFCAANLTWQASTPITSGGSITTGTVGTSGNFATFHGIWSNGANAGNVQMRFRSEVAVASAIVIQAGSYCKYNVF